MKLNIAITISKLVGNATTEKNLTDFHHLKQALEFIVEYAKIVETREKSEGLPFSTELQSSTNRLFIVLRDSSKLFHYRYDPEMSSDLFYQISNGYTDSPELRTAWLATLYAAHLEKTNYEEAGQTCVHIAALINEYLERSSSATGISVGYPGGREALKNISPNVAHEPPLDVSSKAEGKVDSPYFSESGFLSFLTKAILLFKKSDLFELCISIYNVVVAVHQKNRDYERLTEVYADLNTICKVLGEVQNARIFPSYYRVGFYGSIFGELNGVEYIYKEKKGTLLPEVVERLKRQLEQHFGSETEIHVLPNTTDEVDTSKLDPNKCYFQVISVHPHLEPSELSGRVTLWEQRFNVDHFIFETPFTHGGAAQTDDISEQYKRKTILHTEAQFPYMLKRLKVISKKKNEIVLTPIENAIELIDSRNTALLNELNCTPPNIKTLQNVLQGSVLAQVNAGPVRISEVFLGNASKYADKDIKRLRESIHNFVILCARAVELNGKLIKPDQANFQTNLEQGYKEIKQQMLSKYAMQQRNFSQISVSLSVSTKNLIAVLKNKDTEEKSKQKLAMQENTLTPESSTSSLKIDEFSSSELLQKLDSLGSSELEESSVPDTEGRVRNKSKSEGLEKQKIKEIDISEVQLSTEQLPMDNTEQKQ